MEQQKAATEGGTGAGQSNGVAAEVAAAKVPGQQQPKVGDSPSGAKEKKKRKTRKEEHMTEERIDYFINVRKEIEAKGHEIEDEEFDLNDEANFEACMSSLKMWDQCLDNAVRLEQQLLPHVIFDDAEDEAQNNDLIDVIQRVEPVVITNSGLEPLNVKLTEFINNPLSSSGSDDAPLPRTITSINHVAPSFDKIKQMIEDIRAQGDCPLVDLLAPADNPTVYDGFVCKVLADLLDILKRQRFETNVQLIEHDACSREQHRQQQKLQGEHSAAATTSSGSTSTANDGAMTGSVEDPSMLAGSSSAFVEQYNAIETFSSGQETSTHEKFMEAIKKGELQPEGEDVVADGEDLADAEDDESHSEAGSEDFADSAPSAADTAVTACNTVTPQQQQPIGKPTTNALGGEGADDRMETVTEGDGRLTATATETPVQQHQQQASNDDAIASETSEETTSEAAKMGVLSSSEKVRLQKHQLNKLFSSAACLRSSPPLPPSSPISVIKSEIIDLTLDDDNDESFLDDSDDLKIIAEVNEPMGSDADVEDSATNCRFETLSSSESPVSCAEVRTLAGRRKRRSEDEEEAETEAIKRRKRIKADDEAIDDDEQFVETVEEEEEEASTDVVEDSDDEEDINRNGRGKASRTEQGEGSSSGIVTMTQDEKTKPDKKLTTNKPFEDAADHHRHVQQRLLDDDDSIICLSDG